MKKQEIDDFIKQHKVFTHCGDALPLERVESLINALKKEQLETLKENAELKKENEAIKSQKNNL